MTNVVASIDGLYPVSGTTATYSALLTAGTFNLAFDIVTGAKPFVVQASSAAGSATININPAQNTWQATYVVPTALARLGNFAQAAGFVVTDYLSGAPFPGNIIPLSRIDPVEASATGALPPLNGSTINGPNGTYTASGTIPAGGHFTFGTNSTPPSVFGGYINLMTRGTQSASFSLYVDGQMVASKQVPFTTD